MTVDEIEVAMRVLMWLSEMTDDGQLRDDISYVRHELDNWVEMLEEE